MATILLKALRTHTRITRLTAAHSRRQLCASAPKSNVNEPSGDWYTLADEQSEWVEDVSAGYQETQHGERYEPTDLLLFPRFLNDQEQRLVLEHSLQLLDTSIERRPRARRASHQLKVDTSPMAGSPFKEEQEYTFQAGHFDEVISGYREMQVAQFLPPTSSSSPDSSSLQAILTRLQALLPPSTTTTTTTTNRTPLLHLLHLSSQGKIEPHVDNLHASGNTIVGLSLGSTRVMRLGLPSAPIHSHIKVLLLPGSVYVQRDSVRYNLQHSIPSDDTFKNRRIVGAQRLSLMLRNQLE
ncbi:hypothetical protein PCANC_05191 [Puccinia coronata f. sp. avenae]|uniref:Alpha-ketoglutarate-dependent dioxygenase AlkB-like domain-containing protein n=1 Tax=Puccinia coronata f. sp. avenae TaxID=200324 RepID=A0A2N5VN53_9BASI|nr:hypothetical protein PCASD_05247 [Puccinia coronata f. sp. avenae]PLW51418.1 hypothetical protein PCASD_00383 [Puccinia coronata f. sp. avenae]PLW54313.1 hypothetical protein PCANC_05191 [Puccinia coronata f. sp. avenae]